eukprot:Hpha_TRINITY_DN28324_c0_g1::TRINITY_DN28324_c0_g1_i1::g.2235::m.2235
MSSLPPDEVDAGLMFTASAAGFGAAQRSIASRRAAARRAAEESVAAAAAAAAPAPPPPSEEAGGGEDSMSMQEVMGISSFGKRQRLGGGGGFAAMLKKSMAAKAPAPAVQPKPASEEPSEAASPFPSAPSGGAANRLPLTHHAVLQGHHKAVMSLAVDRTGAQVLTGGADYRVRLWRFAGMTDSLRCFRDHEPHEGYPVNDLSYSPNGEAYVASIDHRRPLIFTREGKEVAEFVMGDVYVTQADKTRGHTAATTYAQWAPHDASIIATASRDGTARLWNPETVAKRQTAVYIHRARRPGQKAHCTFAGWSGRRLVTGTEDGRMFVWDALQSGGVGRRPEIEIDAHSGTVTCVAAAGDGRTLASRSLDNTVKLWDLRKPSAAVATCPGLDCYYENTGIDFGLGDRFLVTVTGADPRKMHRGRLVVLHANDLTAECGLPVGVGSCSKVLWPSALNQILVGSQDGGCYVFYDPVASSKGVLLSLARHKAMDVTDLPAPGKVYCPQTQSMKEIFQDAKAKRVSTKPQQKAPTARPKAQAEQRPMSGKAMQLRDFASHTIARQTMRDSDPRAALAAHAEAASADPRFVDQAYAGQPRIFADPDEDDDDSKRMVTGESLKRKFFGR